MNSTPPLRDQRLAAWLKRAYESWATRSLAIGGVATLLDIIVLLIARRFGVPTMYAAMLGVIFGSTVTFFLNRHYAFRDHTPKLAPQALKFIGATGICMLIHGPLVRWLTDRLGVPVVLSKLAADLVVFTGGQLIVLRYLVFPKARPEVASHSLSASHAER